ncbi:hypothetical protein [uncultured Legionella sp.]|uniref:hypothetical protein n=1 Tax=uncultured Legionella sp. TaxID=210934 RepID=UPI0026139D62|nr:hypothetical protein [uncultured Legionella sp.]
MITKLPYRLILLISLFISSACSVANSVPNTIQVTEWAQQVLMDSLNASYYDTPEDINSVQKHYSLEAWRPMNSFFNNELKIIEQYKLSIHPIALTKPQLLPEPNCEYKLCWRVNQKFKLPELNMIIDFSLLISRIIRSDAEYYLIQNLNMIVQRY